MRKIVVSMHVTLDGFAAGPNGEMDWIHIDNEMFDFVKSFTDRADAALYGRVTWQMMEGYWPTAGDKPDATKHDKEHSAWYNAVEKIVLSNTIQDHEAEGTVFLSGDVSRKIREIKQRPGGDILAFGSPSAMRYLMANQLIDEYWLFVNPIILGKGLSMFATSDQRTLLTLDASRTFNGGVVALHYAMKSD